MKIKVYGMLAAALITAGCSEKKEAGKVKPVQVKTTAVASASATDSQGYSGTIEAESGSVLSFASVGTLKSIVVSEGQMVKAGQLIAAIDETSIKQAYEAALAAKEQAIDAEARMKLLHDAGSLPDIKWVEVQTQVRQAVASEKMARKGLADTKLYAPFSGYIARRQAEAGTNVGPGVPVVELVNINKVKVKISVPEGEIAAFRKGQTVKIVVPALGNRRYDAVISEKGVSADPLSRSYEVKAVIGNVNHELLPGMICEVGTRLPDSTQKESSAIMLPANIIQIDFDNRPFVWIATGSKAQKRYVTLGENAGNDIIITDGLTPGDSVIIEGQQKVSAGMEVVDNS